MIPSMTGWNKMWTSLLLLFLFCETDKASLYCLPRYSPSRYQRETGFGFGVHHVRCTRSPP